MIRTVILGVLIFGVCAIADDADQRAKLTGSWQIQTQGANVPSTYTLKPVDDGIQISGAEGGKVVVDVNCKMAQNCKIKDAGHSATVMLYFNGPKLVENETIGSRVVRKRFSITDDNTMQLEIIPIDPEGKTEVVTFKRAAGQ